MASLDCLLCSKTFSSEADAIAHLDADHGGVIPAFSTLVTRQAKRIAELEEKVRSLEEQLKDQ